MECPFGQLASADTATSPSSFMSIPSSLLGGALQGAEGALILCTPCPAVIETLMCSPQIQWFQHKPKNSPIPATLKKIPVSQSKPAQTLMNGLMLLRTPLVHTNEIHSTIQLSAARKLQTWNIASYSEQSPSSKIRQLSGNVRASAGGNRKHRLSHSPNNCQSNKNSGKIVQALINLDAFAVHFSTASYEYCSY